jgi:ribosomal protein L40E
MRVVPRPPGRGTLTRVGDERRCRTCGALVAEDATWCGQCFAPLTDAASAPVPAPAPAIGVIPQQPPPEPRGDPFWPCPVCDNRNPIAADACAVCGTPFARLFRDEESERPTVEPRDALVWSLVFPGLGHRKLGRALDGLARGVLFGVAFLMAVLSGLGAKHGALFGVFALFLIVALAVYVLSAYEAYRIAQGGDVLVGSRALLWTLVLIIFLAVALLAVSAVSSTRR